MGELPVEQGAFSYLSGRRASMLRASVSAFRRSLHGMASSWKR